ncbi:MAG: ferredoxin-type protein NapG [Pseudomonadota bacterium]|nr:ferredoxin-type protein NapG [Pseudomonadota bacterium]
MSINRRTLLQGSATAATAALIAGGAAVVARPAVARPAQAIRPPGAIAEADFLGACVRCGLCVRDCPPQNLKLSAWGDGMAAGVAIGTPYFEARAIPCEMCEDIPCVKACPTGALDPALTDITQARMGTAVLIDQENCLNFLGLRCDVCYRVCPVIDEAITLERMSNPRSDRHAMLLPTVHAERCTGCGMCEKSCVLEEAAIKVVPQHVARGELGRHYRRNVVQRSDVGHVGQTRSGEKVEATPGLPSFDQPTQRLPDVPRQGDLAPLRSGEQPYQPPSILGGQSPAAP